VTAGRKKAAAGAAQHGAGPEKECLPPPARPLRKRFYLRTADAVAEDLIGAYLVKQEEEVMLAGRIVEAEAYLPDDPASHTFSGLTPRTEAAFLEGGRTYVYLIYGMYSCLNVVCGPAGYGGVVLLRALEPVCGLSSMTDRRFHGRRPPKRAEYRLLDGPGKLTAAFGLDYRRDNNRSLLGEGELSIWGRSGNTKPKIVRSRRIGITKAAELELRFCDAESDYLSRPAVSFPDRTS
jgi:DNA-3-methyladenine glycosylase